MSEILSNIVVETNNINFVPDNNNINFSPDAIQLNIFTGAGPIAGGSNTQVQYNDSSILAGSNAFTFNKSTNTVTIENLIVSDESNLGNIANVTITGGTNSYFLQTDGTGNLTWAVYPGNISGNNAPQGANTQIQYNDGGNNFGGSAGFTFDKTSNVVNMPGDLIVAGNISGNTANSNYAAYAGNVINANQSNITSVGTLANLTVNGTTSSNIFSASGNIVSYGYFVGDGSQLSNLFAFQIGNGNSNITVANVNGPIIANVSGVANVMVLNNNSVSFGVDVSLTGNMSVGNLTGTTANLTGNLKAGNANLGNLTLSNYFSGNGSLLTAINGSNVTGQVGNALVAGTVYTNAQPNITSVGTLSTLTVSGTANLGNIGNVKIAGGSSGQFIQTDGAGNLSFGTVNTSTISNGTSSITIPVANGNIVMAVNGSNRLIVTTAGANIANTLTVPTANVTTQLNVANITVTAGNEIALGNGATAVNRGTALGRNALAQSQNSIAIGYEARANTHGTSVGYQAGFLNGYGAVYQTFIGYNAGRYGNANVYSGQTSIGGLAGARADGDDTVAIGFGAGAGLDANLANSVGQGGFAIAVGASAGRMNQKPYAIAIGAEAGYNNQGNGSIAIGYLAGNGQSNNSITLDATGSSLSANIANSFFVKPIRNLANTNVLMYNATSGEISYDELKNYTGYIKTIVTTVGNLTAANTVGAGTKAFVSDANLVAAGNFGAIVGGSGSNNVPVYSDGTNWRIG